MKTKKIIEILTESNSLRRGAEIKMPDVKEFGIAIDEAIKKLKENYDILNSSSFALKTANIQKQLYKNITEEVEILLKKGINNNLILKVIENGKQRADLDLSIQYLFNNK